MLCAVSSPAVSQVVIFFLCFCYQGVVGIEGALDMSIGCLFLRLIAAAYAYSAKMY